MPRMDKAPKEPPVAARPAKMREYVKQTDVPEFSFEESLRVPRVIADQYGKQPTRPADVALALDLLPGGRQFKGLSGSAVAYELTDAASQAEVIGLTDLGRRIVAPTVEGDDIVAMREAFMKPRVIREFLHKYDTSTLPTDERVARNVLEEMGVSRSRTDDTLQLIITTAEGLGLIAEVRGRKVVNVHPSGPPRLQIVPPLDETDDETDETPPAPADAGVIDPPVPPVLANTNPDVPPAPGRNRKVYVSHGSNKKIVGQLKNMLEYGEFEPVVSIERDTTAKPVPKKVFADMNECGAGVIHVAKEKTLLDSDGNEHHVLNENVLIEIGGAMALWGDNFILLVEEGTNLPSNLQGLYEVRYQGDTLDADATMRLLKAFKSFKS